MFEAGVLLSRGWAGAVVRRRRNHLISRAPAAAAVVAAQASPNYFISSLLRFDIDGGVNRKATLGDSRRVFVFKILAHIFNRIVECRRTWLRLIESGVS